MPFFGKSVNKEYGDFYDKNQVPERVSFNNPNHQKNDNPLGTDIPINYQTQTQRDFNQFPEETIEPVEKRIPQDNLFNEHHPFETQYKPISKDYSKKIRDTICPLRKEINKTKKILKEFAKSRKIPY